MNISKFYNNVDMIEFDNKLMLNNRNASEEGIN